MSGSLIQKAQGAQTRSLWYAMKSGEGRSFGVPGMSLRCWCRDKQ
jgi:hypothetical protein